MSRSTARQTTPAVTIAEFDAFLDRQGDDASLYELLDGDIVMMSNPTEIHEIIVSNISAPLTLAMKQRGCFTYTGGMVQRSADVGDVDKTKPDILVRCGGLVGDGTRIFIEDPIVIVEVLSPSTEDNDRERKLPFYRTLPSTRHIVHVSQVERRIEHWHRPDGETPWHKTVLPLAGDTLRLDAVAFTITLDEVYDGLPSLAKA